MRSMQFFDFRTLRSELSVEIDSGSSNEYIRIANHGPTNGDTLALTTRQLVGLPRKQSVIQEFRRFR